MKHVEMIIDYIVDGDDFQYCDNTGRLIRCKDCKYWQDNNNGYPVTDCKWNKDETPEADDFCSGAERRTEQ